jgi:cystathionine beta-lyase/cystathionine gamma-synthase
MNDDPSVIALHADRIVGDGPDIAPPLHLSTTYDQTEQSDLVYARKHHPTRDRLEAVLGALEGGEAVCYPSGMAAIAAVLRHLRPRRVTLPGEDLYPGTREFLEAGAAAGEWELGPGGDVVFVETPSNPRCIVTDVAAAAAEAHGRGARLVVDATFATPVLLRPLDLGADVVVHSTTKYINGHSDIIGGMLVVQEDRIAEELRFIRKSTGAVPGPWDAWLCLRGVKTLHVRMQRHNENGMAVASFLEGDPRCGAVHYPGLPSHPQHELARRQMSGFTGMVSLDLGEAERAKRFVEATGVFSLAESLGGVESLISIPALMTHASVPEADRERMGVTTGLVRLSVGIEDGEDLVEDLVRALDSA